MLRREFAAMPTAALAQSPTRPKASVMLWTLKGTFEQKLEIAAEAGCESVELVGEHLAWSEADAKRYVALARSMKLGLDTISAMPNWGREPVSMVDPAQRDGMLKEVARQIEWAKRIEVPQLLLMSGNSIAGRTFDEQYASMLEGCKRAGELAAKAQVTMIIEPLNNKVDHKGFFMSNCVDGLRMVKETGNPHVRLLFDIYHEQVQLGNVTRTIEAAAQFTTVFHVADNPGRHEPGTGEMNYAHLYAAIKKTGYSHYVTMEYLPTGDQRASLQKCVREMRAVL
ncbi:MAG: TIM barrel protein [Bryobacteraceae bacterium]|nr:TIM barrel protein [Bryobacteraceae bacterium]